MEDRVFLFDYANQTWYETHDEKYFVDDISNLPYIFTSRYRNGFTGEFWEEDKVWCSEHQTFEEIAECGKNFVKTSEGCKIEGIFTQTSRHSSYFYRDDKVLCFRYRVYRDADCSIKVDVDIAGVKLCVVDLKPANIKRERFTYKVEFSEECKDLEIIPTPQERYQDFFPQANEDIKEALGVDRRSSCEASEVTTAILEFLREDAIKKFDFNVPIIKSNLPDRIAAFLYRPLDSNIAEFKMYFFDNVEEFEKLFPKDSRENFSVLCRELGLTATDELRKCYEENPFAIVIFMMLQRFGIKNPELIQKFMHLTEFCGETLNTSRTRIGFNIFSDSKTDIKNFDYKATKWENLLFYCRWYLKNSSEEKLADELLRLNKNFDWTLYRAWDIFRSYFDEISAELKDEILQSGISSDTVNKLVLIEDDRNFFVNDVNFSDEEKNFECKINGYNIRCVNSFRKLENISVKLKKISSHNLVNKDSTVFAVEKNGRYIDIVALDAGKYSNKIGRYYGSYNEIVEGTEIQREVAAIILYWTSHFGTGCPDLRYSNLKPCFKNFVIESVDEDKNFENLSLLKLLQLPEEKICTGYYLMLYRRFAEVNLYENSKLKHFDNEKDFLMNLFPLGERIYNAAFDGNAEAQYVLSKMYRCGFCFDYFNIDKSNRWYKKALENGWLES